MPRKAKLPKQIKTSFYVDAADLEELKKISDRTMIPVSRLFRKAIKDVIKEYSTK